MKTIASLPRSRSFTTLAGHLGRPGAIAVLVILALGLPAVAQDDFTYTANSDGVTITKYIGAGGEVTIHPKINGKRVTAIGLRAFYYCTNVTGVTILGSVVSIGNSAFEGCRNLANVALPESLTSLGARAFFGCASLGSITLPGSIRQWPVVWDDVDPYPVPPVVVSRVFQGCTNLTSLTIGDGVQSIPPYAFSGCVNLKTVLLPNSLIRIANNAFEVCRSLTGLTIPNSVTNLGAYAFSGCTSLTSLALPGTITEWSVVTNYHPFPPILGLPEYIANWGSWVFADCTNITAVTVGEGISSIPSYGFSNCVSLGSVLLPNTLSSIGEGAFEHCSSLIGVTIPKSVTRLGASAFARCTSLTSITIPGSVTDWVLSDSWSWSVMAAAWTFSGCTNLTIATIDDGVPNIPPYAFSGCVRLASFSIPKSVTNLASVAFADCSSLGAINVDALNPAYSSAEGALLDKNRNTLLKCPQAMAGHYTIPDGVTAIDSNAFYTCASLTSVTIPNTVTSIGNSAFYRCSSLTRVIIPTSVARLGAQAFYGCTGLSGVTIPDSVTSLGDFAFRECSGLTNVSIGNSVTNIGQGTFDRCSTLSAINVDGLNPAYSSAEGALLDKSHTTLLKCPEGMTGSYTIPEDVTNIAANAFYTCVSLTSVRIPDTVRRIGNSAFLGCSSLTGVTIPNSVTRLGAYAFYGCTSLTNVTIPGSVTDWVTITSPPFLGLGGETVSATFGACTNLRVVTVEDGVTNIPIGAFAGCSRLTCITVPHSVTSLGTDLAYSGSPPIFGGCTNLTGIYFEGNSPILLSYELPPTATVYYLPGTTGWGATYGGCPTALWTPQVQAIDSGVGGGTNGFGFTLSWARGKVVTVEACASLADPVWSPVQTLTLTNGSSYFADPEWAKYPGRFYRIRAQ